LPRFFTRTGIRFARKRSGASAAARPSRASLSGDDESLPQREACRNVTGSRQALDWPPFVS